jgi:hypothetical protein
MAQKSPAQSCPTGVGCVLHCKEERLFAMEYTAYSSKPTRSIKDKEECVVYSIVRRRGCTRWSTQHTPPLLLVMEMVAYSLPSII